MNMDALSRLEKETDTLLNLMYELHDLQGHHHEEERWYAGYYYALDLVTTNSRAEIENSTEGIIKRQESIKQGIASILKQHLNQKEELLQRVRKDVDRLAAQISDYE